LQDLEARQLIDEHFLPSRNDLAGAFGDLGTIGVLMLIFALRGSLGWFAKTTPRAVVRGIQLGLALTLIVTAIGFMQKSGAVSILGVNVFYLAVAAICFAIVLALWW
jgi:MFS superfamily sulfate permease-like transporter